MNPPKLILSMVVLGASFLLTNSAFATTWYVRDGGGTPSQCTGTTNAVYPGSGTAKACAFSNPMFALGAGCGNTGGNTCDVPGVMQSGDTLDIVGDSDLNSGSQAQYPIGLDVTGVITPTNGNNCYAPAPENCTMGNIPATSSVIGIGNHRPQLWGREQVAQVLNDNNSTSTVINNLEITQHSSCVYNGADPQGTTGGFPNQCHTPDGGFSSPFGNWGLAGVSLTGSNITFENNWVHGMGQWGVSTGSLTNLTETNNIISGNGGGGMGLGQNISNAGTMTLGGTTTVNGDIIVFNGCGEMYPMHSSDPFDTLNYHNCADDSSSNGTILADGWAMEAGSGICNNVTMSNTIVSYNTKGGIDNLHCNGTGTFNAYRVRAEGNESQQMKLNYATVNIENSQLINDCNYFEGQAFETTCDAYGNCPPVNGYDFCRASGNGLRLATVNGGTYNISNSTFYSDGGANIELPPDTCNSATVVNVNNNLIVNGPDYTNGDTQNTDFWENDTGSCNPIVENNNLVYQANDPSHCAGSKDICTNPSNAGVTGNFALNSSYVYPNTGLADQFYVASSSPLIGAANSSLTLSGTPNDENGFSRGSSWDIGAYQHGSTVANGGICFSSGECSSSVCSNNVCAVKGPTVSIISPTSGSSVTAGNNVTVTATASETNGTISNISIYSGTGALLGSSDPSPYSFVMSNVAAGTYTFYAVATDANGLSTTSGLVTITVENASILPSTPVVAITSPASGSNFTAGSNATVTVTASETNGTINNISLYNGSGVLLGSGSTSPYNYVASNMLAGTYTYTAQATDANGVSVTSSPVTVTVTAPASSPVVAITSPGNNAVFTNGPLPINLSATASETNGTIAKVQFFNGTVPLSYNGTSAPFNYTWNNVQPGTYTMTAVATDANGNTTTSSPITITVTAAVASPVVAITSPANGSSFTAGSTMTIAATASESNGTISKVVFYNGSTLLGTSTSSPYSYTWGNVAAGSYNLTAVATDANGVSTTSSAVTVAVTASALPVVSLASNATSFTAPASIVLTANASETNGSISKVSFYNGAALLGTSTSSPYSYTWSNVAAGSYSLTAVATDANGNSVTSSAVSVTVNAPALPVVSLSSNAASFTAPASIVLTANASEANGSISKVAFYNGSALLSTDTSSPYSFTWSNVAAGSYSLTAVATDANGVSITSSAISVTVTAPALPVVSLASNATSFTAPASIVLTANASETNGSISKVAFYNGSALLSTDTSSPYSFTWSNVVAGSYNLTAVATDANGNSVTSSAVSVTVTAPPAAPSNSPTSSTVLAVSLTSPVNNLSYTVPASITVTAKVSGGTPGYRVDFSADGGAIFLGESTSSPYTATWTSAQAGTYSIVATVTDSTGAAVSSSPVNITVNAHKAPTISITTPTNNTSYKAPTNITIKANAVANGGTIVKVDYYSNGWLYLGTAYSSPYSITWYAQAGTYAITAKATDSTGWSTMSNPVTVSVK